MQELDLLHLGAGALLGPDLHEDPKSLVVAVLRDQPARRLRHLQHPDEQADRGDGGDREHVPPHPGVLTPDVADDGVDRECEQLADDDRQLASTGEAAPALGGASSARYTGTVTEAPPTAKPRITRDGIMIARFGASTPPMVPTKNRTASMVSVFFGRGSR